MGKFQSTKVFDGFSCVFRQWKAETTHCKYVHGYGVSFKVWFEGELDERNWVWDFGGMKRAKTTKGLSLISGSVSCLYSCNNCYKNEFNAGTQRRGDAEGLPRRNAEFVPILIPIFVMIALDEDQD